VTIAVFSQVKVLLLHEQATDDGVRVSRHCYRAGLWDADTFGQCQYEEGLRRYFEQILPASSMLWIGDVTAASAPWQATARPLPPWVRASVCLALTRR
jgi:hypothetical protein